MQWFFGSIRSALVFVLHLALLSLRLLDSHNRTHFQVVLSPFPPQSILACKHVNLATMTWTPAGTSMPTSHPGAATRSLLSQLPHGIGPPRPRPPLTSIAKSAASSHLRSPCVTTLYCPPQPQPQPQPLPPGVEL